MDQVVLEVGVLVGVEQRNIGASPLLVCLTWPWKPFIGFQRRAPAVAQPVRLTLEEQVLKGGFRNNHCYPTEPSISSWMRRFNSTAYSSGSSFVNGSMNPLTIIVSASLRVMPRLIR